MPRTKKTGRKVRPSAQALSYDEGMTQDLAEPYADAPSSSPRIGGMNKLTWTIVLGVIVFAFVLWNNKGWVVAATVNGKPIWRWDLNSTLMARFGKQTLEGMISESLIADTASREHVSVLPADVTKRQDQIVKSLGGASIDDLLKFQGMTRAEFDKQVQLQLLVSRLVTKDLSITENDIDAYIATNRATLVATDPAELRDEARQAIIDETVTKGLQSWFASLQEKAKVVRVL